MRLNYILALTLAGAMSCLAQTQESGVRDEIASLRMQLAAQQQQIEQLKAALDGQQRTLERLALSESRPAPVQSAAVQSGASQTQTTQPPVAPSRSAAPEDAPGSARTPQGAVTLDELAKRTETGLKNLGGFQFSGDFRFRADVQARSGNEIAGPLQNVRSRYRVRMNIDKQIDPRFKFHLQLSTGPYNVATTNDQDMGATAAKHPFSVAEAYIDFKPNKNISIRGGRGEEVFADNMRFLWDDDVRFNGFHQIVNVPLGSSPLGLKSIEFRAGEYILSNPAIYVMPANSPYAAAGYQTGQKVRGANLFHPGFIARGDLSSGWAHQFMGGIEIYRNPDEIQLASTPNGFPVVVSNTLGLQLSGPMAASGNATTTPGGAIYSAPNFQIAHAGYRLERKGVRIGGKEMPAWLDLQASRNVGTSKLRDAMMVSANLGAIKNTGDLRFLYQFAIKDANSMISQFTDDDLGTGTGVNIAVHAFRVDVGLTRFLQWQNLLFVQNERRRSNPSEQLFIPLQKGANETFRYLGQLAFTF